MGKQSFILSDSRVSSSLICMNIILLYAYNNIVSILAWHFWRVNWRVYHFVIFICVLHCPVNNPTVLPQVAYYQNCCMEFNNSGVILLYLLFVTVSPKSKTMTLTSAAPDICQFPVWCLISTKLQAPRIADHVVLPYQ